MFLLGVFFDDVLESIGTENFQSTLVIRTGCIVFGLEAANILRLLIHKDASFPLSPCHVEEDSPIPRGVIAPVPLFFLCHDFNSFQFLPGPERSAGTTMSRVMPRQSVILTGNVIRLTTSSAKSLRPIRVWKKMES